MSHRAPPKSSTDTTWFAAKVQVTIQYQVPRQPFVLGAQHSVQVVVGHRKNIIHPECTIFLLYFQHPNLGRSLIGVLLPSISR